MGVYVEQVRTQMVLAGLRPSTNSSLERETVFNKPQLLSKQNFDRYYNRLLLSGFELRTPPINDGSIPFLYGPTTANILLPNQVHIYRQTEGNQQNNNIEVPTLIVVPDSIPEDIAPFYALRQFFETVVMAREPDPRQEVELTVLGILDLVGDKDLKRRYVDLRKNDVLFTIKYIRELFNEVDMRREINLRAFDNVLDDAEEVYEILSLGSRAGSKEKIAA